MLAICDFEPGNVRIKLLPLDLDLNLNRPRSVERGLPDLPSAERGREIAQDLARMSEVYGTRISYDASDGPISVTAG